LNELISVARQFTARTVTALQPLGRGLINDTFLVTAGSGHFVMQRVNRQVFPEPELISANLQVVSRHVRHCGFARLTLPEPLQTRTGADFYWHSNGDFWRGQHYIADSESLERLTSMADAQQAGFALGHFHRLLSDLKPDLLHDTLPGFHIAPDYLNHYQETAASAEQEDPFCAEFIAQCASFVAVLETAKQTGLLPLRVTHGDPKLDNFLFHRHTRQIISLVDLDTVKPGLVQYDIADCLRSCCHQHGTDRFDLALCATVLAAYLAEARHFYTACDYDFLYPALRLLPFELGLRFYTDHLQGNRYFKVDTPGQNLQRAIQQFRLCADIMTQEKQILSLLRRLQADSDSTP